ncbi:MAG TPA: aryl-sulfate sulfotransferase [Candidatus Thermoplasmatota archaeon]|nr:aryl-sulfate sulfotransferase [Candidatus Thermoplasmatota archaeon]
MVRGCIKMNLKLLLKLPKIIQLAKPRTISLILIIFLLGTCVLPSSLTQQMMPQKNSQSFTLESGQILYSPMWGTATYLIDKTGTVNHTWPSIYLPGVAVWWLGDGTILRTIRLNGGPGAGGGVQEVDWDGTVTWDFRYNTDGHLSHHDVKSLPNGDVLLIAWETKTRDEAIEAGRNPDYVSSQGLLPDEIIEVKPTGPTSGAIVWEWHVWDHLIQDFDSSKANYGVVADHPELVDINYRNTTQMDLMHTNSIDYNQQLDQLLISVCYFNEIWVIDHSTTTEEAAGHTGGNSGKGGDILYRWGNPQAYRRGTANDQKLFLQHDATWIHEGCPGEGDILVFNNEVNHHSRVDEIVPPMNNNSEYYIENDSAYGPVSTIWNYSDPGFYAGQFGGAVRLANGNTLITNGETGKIFEVNPEEATVWQYDAGDQLFKAVYIPSETPPEPDIPNLDCSGSLSWTRIEPGGTVNGSFQVQNIGGENSKLNWRVNTSSIQWGNWTFTPESGTNLTPQDGSITLQVSVIAPDEKKSTFQGYLRVENIDNSTDFDLVPVILKTSVPANLALISHSRQILLRFFQNHVLLTRLLYNLIS